MIYLDANIFIYAITNTEFKGECSRQILTKIAKKEVPGCTSLLTWDEFIHILKKWIGREAANIAGNKFLNFPNLTFLRVEENVIIHAQNLMTKYNLNPRDAIHIASALVNNVTEILTDDLDFDNIKEIKRLKIEKFS